MKFYYLDAENIGLSNMEKLAFSLFDRVFVFTNNPVVQSECRHPSMVVLSGYPDMSNQADFYIIAHLSNVLSYVQRAERKTLEFILMSRDRSLCAAFEFQCSQSGVSSVMPLLTESNVPVSASNKLQNRILQLLSTPMTFNDVHKQLSQPKEAVITPFNQLIHTGLIKRQPESKKLWIRVGNQTSHGSE